MGSTAGRSPDRDDDAGADRRAHAHRAPEDLAALGRTLFASVSHFVSDVIEERRAAGLRQARRVARAMRDAADDMAADAPGIARFADQAADTAEGVARRLRDQDAQGMVQGIGDFARRHPAAFLGASFAGGLALAGLLRAATPPRRAGGGDQAA